MSEFKDKNTKDLLKALTEKRDALQDFRFGVSGGKAKNVKEGRTLRKDIARILTELNAQAKISPKAPVVKTTKAKVVRKVTKKAKVAKTK